MADVKTSRDADSGTKTISNGSVYDKEDTECLEEWGFSLKDTYRHTLRFYKENEGKSVQLQYNDKLRLVAYTQQSHHGTFSEDKVPPLGALDVIGKNRRNAWAALGDMDRGKAMKCFVDEVLQLMPHLRPYLEAQKKDEQVKQEALTREKEEAVEAAKRDAATAEAERLADEERQRQEEQRRQIQDALNHQTYDQFRAYAEQQYPSNPDQQAVLVRQLQEQHYYQYMQQIYQQQMETQASNAIMATSQQQQEQAGVATNGLDMSSLRLEDGPLESISNAANPLTNNGVQTDDKDDDEDDEDDEDEDGDEEEEHQCSEDCGYCQVEEISPASMWTKKELVEFKDSLRKEGGDSIIKVGHGETVTVRVPTHKEGSALFWEFATDSYDIAFGLFFEWTQTEESEVSVHISDSEDEDVEDDYNDENGDPETGSTTALMDKGPPTSVIVPIYRRDCHTEVYAGTHTYPGQGVYLLKFDNTYSLWRSKTLYYRVYYTR